MLEQLIAGPIRRFRKKKEFAEQGVLEKEVDTVKKCRSCGGLTPVDHQECGSCGILFVEGEEPELVRICPTCSTQSPALRSTCRGCGLWFG